MNQGTDYLSHVWYSPAQDKVHGHVFYRLRDGTEVKVTNACGGHEDREDTERFNFPDAVYLGMGSFVREGDHGIRGDELGRICTEADLLHIPGEIAHSIDLVERLLSLIYRIEDDARTEKIQQN